MITNPDTWLGDRLGDLEGADVGQFDPPIIPFSFIIRGDHQGAGGIRCALPLEQEFVIRFRRVIVFDAQKCVANSRVGWRKTNS